MATWFGLGKPEKQGHLQAYVLLWLLALALLLFVAPERAVAPSGKQPLGLLGWLILGAAFYRLQDLLFASVDDALDLTSTYVRFDWRGRIVLLLVNLIQVVLVFAIAYVVIIGHDIVPAALQTTHSHLDYLVVSWNGLPPLGSAPPTQLEKAPALTMAEAGVGLLIVVIAVSAFVGRHPDRVVSNIRKLTEERDAGRLTNEEYEAKKAELF